MPKEKCQPIRDKIRDVEEGIREAEDLLPELAGPVKGAILAFIKREKQHLKQLRVALRACESS
jgi:hypothetical protein